VALQAIDNQIAREMQRTPAGEAQHGTLKFQPFESRIERISADLLNWLGENLIELDSLLVLAQASSKALQLVIHDLGKDGLGKVRRAYCEQACQRIRGDAERAIDAITDQPSMV